MATLEETESFLVNVENAIKELKQRYEGKQSERVLSSHVWMIDYLDQIIKYKVTPLRDALTSVKKAHVGDFKSATQCDAVIGFCNDIIKLLNDLNNMYKARMAYVDIRLKFQYTLPQLIDKLQHLRNRFNIIKGQINNAKVEINDDWF